MTDAAFNAFRSTYGPPRAPDPARIANSDELILIPDSQGLLRWQDGSIGAATIQGVAPIAPPIPYPPKPHLWVVRSEDVVYADEQCPFGATLETGVIKHTNLTGGADAYVGGEMILAAEGQVVVNGRSGRYPARTTIEMAAAAKAFKDSGYIVWSMGFDDEAGFPNPFVGVVPQLVT